MAADRVTSDPAPTSSSGGASLPARMARWASLVLHLAVAVFPLSASGLMAPPWALAVIALGWLVGLIAVWRIGSRRPFAALLVPIGTVAAWFALMSMGEFLLGWTA